MRDWKDKFEENQEGLIVLNTYQQVEDLIPGENCPIGEKEKKVWRKFCTESYLNWKLFYRIRPLSEVAKDMLNKETIVLRRPFTTYISELFPVFHRMSLVSMDERRMEFSIHNSNTHGVQIDSQTKKRIFKEFWKEVERSHDPKGYVASIIYESMKLFCKIMFRRFFCDAINIVRRVFIMERQKKPVYRVQIFKTKKNSKISL